VRRGDGTYVTSLEPRRLLEALSFIVGFHRDDTLLEFLRVRRILEPAVTAMAAERITAAEKRGPAHPPGQHRPGPRGRGTGGQPPGVPPADRCPRGQLGALLAARVDVRADYPARVWRGLTQTGARSQTLAEHRAILDALAAHDAEVARSWATVHIAGVEQWLALVP
jgi:DNA-binding FadR family transcriptional regulator